jgi:hypothetical protein
MLYVLLKNSAVNGNSLCSLDDRTETSMFWLLAMSRPGWVTAAATSGGTLPETFSKHWVLRREPSQSPILFGFKGLGQIVWQYRFTTTGASVSCGIGDGHGAAGDVLRRLEAVLAVLLFQGLVATERALGGGHQLGSDQFSSCCIPITVSIL